MFQKNLTLAGQVVPPMTNALISAYFIFVSYFFVTGTVQNPTGNPIQRIVHCVSWWVAISLSRRDFFRQTLGALYTLVYILSSQHTEFIFSDVQLTAVFGRVMYLQTLRNLRPVVEGTQILLQLPV